MRTPEPAVLSGYGVTLEPLGPQHVDDLAASTGGDPDVWAWLQAFPRTRADMAAVVADAVDDPDRSAYAVVVDGRAQGSTSYLDVDLSVEGLEVGWTWYAKALWATHVNPACKLLVLGHAFEALGAQRVTLKTDALNARSRAAIGKLGCAYDGTLRHHKLRADGSVRDSAYFSLLVAEWPGVRAGLLARLGG